jgi:diacylglycerol kinase (ATP)
VAVLFFVLAVELLNSAVEAAVDRHGDEHHELSGAAKDLGSAAVFVSLTIVVVAWGAVVYDRFYA